MIYRIPAILLAVFCLGLLSPVTAQAQQSNDQIAIQLGAIQLGINLTGANDQQKADALAQGRLALRATQTKFDPQAFVAGATTPQPQSAQFRAQLEQAVGNALANPVSLNVDGTANLANGGKVRAKGELDPSLTTASALLNQTLKRLPNLSPGLVIAAIEAALANPQKFGKPGTGEQDAYKLAEIAMRAGLRTYVKGTRQWSGVGPGGLPNFSTLPVNGVNPNLNGLMDAASAIAANAINALGPLKNNPQAVAAMTAALVKGAVRFQKTSQTSVDGNRSRYGGATSATATGLIAQLSGVAQGDWKNATTGTLLNAVVTGAMKAAKKQVVSIAYGAAAGFAGTYLATGGLIGNFNINQVAADILASFEATNAVKDKNKADVNAAILAGLNAGLNQANWTDPVNGIAGIGGIKNFTVVNGQGAPLTDTVGL